MKNNFYHAIFFNLIFMQSLLASGSGISSSLTGRSNTMDPQNSLGPAGQGSQNPPPPPPPPPTPIPTVNPQQNARAGNSSPFIGNLNSSPPPLGTNSQPPQARPASGSTGTSFSLEGGDVSSGAGAPSSNGQASVPGQIVIIRSSSLGSPSSWVSDRNKSMEDRLQKINSRSGERGSKNAIGTLQYLTGKGILDGKNIVKLPSLKAGQVLKTGENSLALIKLFGGINLKVFSQGEVQLKDHVEIKISEDNVVTVPSLSLAKGSSIFNVGDSGEKAVPHLHLNVDGAVISIKKAEFFAGTPAESKANQRPIWLHVKEGEIEVKLKNGMTQKIKSGESFIIENNDKIQGPQKFAWEENLNWNLNPSVGKLENKSGEQEQEHNKREVAP